MQRGWGAGPRHNHRGVIHRAVFAELFDRAGHGRFLLPNRHVKALHARIALVDDRVDGDCCLTCLTVTNDQFALATANRGHRVDGLDAGLQRLMHGLAFRHTGGDHFDRAALVGHNRAFAVERIPQRIDHAAQEFVTHGHAQQGSGAANFFTFVDVQIVAEDNHADRVLFEVERQASHAAGELDHFTRHDAGQTVNLSDTVAHFQHAANIADVDVCRELLDLFLDH